MSPHVDPGDVPATGEVTAVEDAQEPSGRLRDLTDCLPEHRGVPGVALLLPGPGPAPRPGGDRAIGDAGTGRPPAPVVTGGLADAPGGAPVLAGAVAGTALPDPILLGITLGIVD